MEQANLKFDKARTRSAGYKALCLFLLLPVGALVFFVLSRAMSHRYNDSGFGHYYGYMQARIYYFGTDRTFGVVFEGKTPAHWHWSRPNNYQYDLLDFRWSVASGEGYGKIDTATMTLMLPDRSIKVTQSSLLELLYSQNATALQQEEIDRADCVLRLIIEAKQGQLLPPRHHNYMLEECGGGLTHFSLGSRYPYSLFWWAGIWAILCLGTGLRHKWISNTKDVTAAASS